MAALFDGKLPFWKLAVPIYIDISLMPPSAPVLFERWALTFTESPSAAHHAAVDRSELILLTQSLYSFVRLLPLHAAADLDLGYRVWSPGSHALPGRIGPDDVFAGSVGFPSSPTFSVASKLRAYRFKPGIVPGLGKLSLSVLFDTNPRNLADAALKASWSVPGVPWDAGADPRGVESIEAPSPPEPAAEVVKISYIDPYDADPVPPRPSPLFASPSPSPPSIPLSPPRASSPMPIPRTSLSASPEEAPLRSPSRLSLGSRGRQPLSRLSTSLSSPEPDVPGDGLSTTSFRSFRRESESFGVQRRRSSGRLWTIPGTPPWPLSPTMAGGYNSEPFGTLVGSYEESLLTGRMSALPSHPVVFECQIGVIGTYSKCPPHLKCPPHVNVNFPAYFYELPGQDRSITPYVGVIDLDTINSDFADGLTEAGRKVAQRESRMSREDGAEHCGYRIPMKGQLQIIIKNPSLTAIKVFLVQYDFRDMPPGTKTFLRQKSYAVPKAADGAATFSPGAGKKPPLRYAIHLHFASPARRRLYLCRSMRVVFSPRGNDSEEKLQVVMGEPDDAAKYTPLEAPFPGRAPGHKRSSTTNLLDIEYAFSNLVM
ncbi:hypothetical protein DFJ74DRAFT_666207 [Hyaloraphidium curvatum]|nr:hypothetical protein DFJ74DRAFT_666207 [Hyaloraphidium curvatum]